MKPADSDVLLIIDVQNDFCDGGALAVRGGQDVVPIIHRIAPLFQHLILTQDWHPQDHHSFASNHSGRTPFDTVRTAHGEQVLWPDHCVQGTPGAAFHPDLLIDRVELILRKGFRKSIDSYSAFHENDRTTPTGLTGYLRERGMTRVYVAGLAYDYCVRYSAVDSVRAGFETFVVEDACRAIDHNGTVSDTNNELQQSGVQRIASATLLAA